MLSLPTISASLAFVQESFFPQLAAHSDGAVTPKHRDLILHLDVIRFENWLLNDSNNARGRPEHARLPIMKAFYAKALWNLPTTRHLLDRLAVDSFFRRICGWERTSDIPSEATFSRAFSLFANQGLLDAIHEQLAEDMLGETTVLHLSLDSTAIEAREKPIKIETVDQPKPPKRKRGRPPKGTPPIPKEPTRLEQQLANPDLDSMLKDLPMHCAVGTKMNSKGYKTSWIGYKLHLDVADSGFPVSALVTSAAMHDSQAAIPLKTMSAQRCQSCYDLMDSAYDAQAIYSYCESLGHKPLIDKNIRSPAQKEACEQELRAQRRLNITYPQAVRYNERSTAERCNTRMKDDYNARSIRVRGHAKVTTHLMMGVIAVSVDVCLRHLI